jgi:hypothetical protein
MATFLETKIRLTREKVGSRYAEHVRFLAVMASQIPPPLGVGMTRTMLRNDKNGKVGGALCRESRAGWSVELRQAQFFGRRNLKCCHSDAERGGGICLRITVGRKIDAASAVG